MQLTWVCMALCAMVSSCVEARYGWNNVRGLRMYQNGLKGGYRKGYNKPTKDKILQLELFDQLTDGSGYGSGDGSGDGTNVDDIDDTKGGISIGDGVEPFDPSDIGKGIEPEVSVTTSRPRPRTPRPYDPWQPTPRPQTRRPYYYTTGRPYYYTTSRPRSVRPYYYTTGSETARTVPQRPYYYTTERPQPRTEEPENYWGFWNNVKSAVGDIGNTLDDVASNVGDTVGDWGSNVGDTVGDWGSNVGDTVGDWGESVGEAFNDFGENVADWGENVGETFNEWGDDVSNTLDKWGDTIYGVGSDIHGNIGETFDEAQVQVQQAHIALIEAARMAGEKLKQTYLEAREGLPTLKEQVLDSLRHFGILVSNGAKYVCAKITQITDQVHSSAIIQKIQEKLEQGDEKVAEFLQLIGHKMETWFQSHTQLTHTADVFQDAEIQGELQELVNYGILTQNDVTVLTETSQISEKLKQLMERGDASVTKLIQLLEQKIARWSEDTEGGISQITQQLPSFFQDYDIQEELKELVEQGILTTRDIEMLTESTSVISKLEQALERGDDRVTEIITLMAEREAVVEQQQDQHMAEIIPNIFQDDEVQQDLQELVDAGVFTKDDFNILTQQTSKKGVITIEKRQHSERGWFDSIGKAFNDLGDVIEDTVDNVGDTVSDWGDQVGEFAVNAADQVVDAAAGAKDAIEDAVYDKRYVFPKKLLVGKRGWFDSVGDTFEGWGDNLSDWGGHVSRFASNAADKVVDVAVDTKDAIANAFQKRGLSPADIRK